MKLICSTLISALKAPTWSSPGQRPGFRNHFGAPCKGEGILRPCRAHHVFGHVPRGVAPGWYAPRRWRDLSVQKDVMRDSAELRRNFQQLAHGSAHERHAIGIAEARRRKNFIHRCYCPWERIIRAHADLADSACGDQVPESLRREDDRIEIELLHVFRGFFLNLHFALFRKDQAPMVHAISIRSKIAASMRCTDFQVGKAVKGAFKNHVRTKN